jgi:threonine dehydrogenase-like Zn-dependent dehydrogenase
MAKLMTLLMLLKTVQAKKIDPACLITHRLKLDQILDAYDTFARRGYACAEGDYCRVTIGGRKRIM